MSGEQDLLSTKNKILQAAGQVLIKEGVKSLTLESVAKEAGLSKGGLLYHFPTKEALIRGMVEQLDCQFNSLINHNIDLSDDNPGQLLRAFIRAVQALDDDLVNTGVSLLTVAATDPKLLDPLRENYQQWQQQIENDWVDPALATVIRLAIDGLWFAETFNLAPPRGPLRDEIFRQLLDLSTGGADELASDTLATDGDWQ